MDGKTIERIICEDGLTQLLHTHPATAQTFFRMVGNVGTGSVSWERFCLLKSSLMPFESGKLPARTAASRGCPK